MDARPSTAIIRLKPREMKNKLWSWWLYSSGAVHRLCACRRRTAPAKGWDGYAPFFPTRLLGSTRHNRSFIGRRNPMLLGYSECATKKIEGKTHFFIQRTFPDRLELIFTDVTQPLYILRIIEAFSPKILGLNQGFSGKLRNISYKILGQNRGFSGKLRNISKDVTAGPWATKARLCCERTK